MNTIPYQTQQQFIKINDDLLFIIESLLNQQQFYDPEHKAERLGICSAAWPLFGLLWPSSIQLAKKLLKRPIARCSKVLEIGCGLGIASLTAKSIGYDITASDRHPLARHFLEINASLNDLVKPRFQHAQWGSAILPSIKDTNAPLLSGKFNHILASDVLYEPDNAVQVAEFIHQFSEYDCTVWIVDPNRGYHNQMTKAMHQHGFVLNENLRLIESMQNEVYRGRLLVYTRGKPVAVADSSLS